MQPDRFAARRLNELKMDIKIPMSFTRTIKGEIYVRESKNEDIFLVTTSSYDYNWSLNKRNDIHFADFVSETRRCDT